MAALSYLSDYWKGPRSKGTAAEREPDIFGSVDAEAIRNAVNNEGVTDLSRGNRPDALSCYSGGSLTAHPRSRSSGLIYIEIYHELYP